MVNRKHPKTVTFRVSAKEKELIEQVARSQEKRVDGLLRELVIPRVTPFAGEPIEDADAVAGEEE